jgi:hypothetical protein
MPRRDTPTARDTENTIRQASADENRRSDEGIDAPEIPGLPEDLDDVNVVELTGKAIEALEEWQDSLEGEDAGNARNTILKIKEYVSNFAEDDISPEDAAANSAKAKELEDKYGENILRLVHAEYNHEFIQTITLIQALTEDRDNVSNITLAMANLLSVEIAPIFNFDTDAAVAEQLQNAYGSEENARKALAAINAIKQQSRHPFHEHAQEILDNYDDSTDGKRRLIRHLHTEETRRADRCREIIELVDEVAPPEPTEIAHERPSSLEGIDYADYDHLLDEAVDGTIDQELLARDIRTTLTNPKLGGLINKRQKKTGHESYSMREYGTVTIGEGPDAKNMAFNIDVQRGVIYEYVRRGERKGINMDQGQTSWNERDFDVVAVPRHSWRLDTLVKAEDMLELLTEHYREDGDVVHTLQVTKEGEVKVLSLTRREYKDMVESAQTAVEEFTNKFTRMGVNLTLLREQQRREQYIEEKEARPNSWIEQQRAMNGVMNVVETVRAGGTLNPEAETQVTAALNHFYEMYAETQTYYGSSSKYEMLAREHLLVQGMREEDEGWPEALKGEINRISVEMTQRDYILSEISSEVQRRARDIRLVRHMEGMSPAERADEEQRLQDELNDLLRNIDYNFEIRLYSRMSSLDVDAEGAHVYDSYQHAVTTVKERFGMLNRELGANANIEALEETRDEFFTELPGEIAVLHDHEDRLSTYLEAELDEFITAAENYSRTMRNLYENGQRLLDAAEAADATEPFGFDRATWEAEVKKVISMISRVANGENTEGLEPIIQAAENLTEWENGCGDETVSWALDDLVSNTWIEALQYDLNEIETVRGAMDPEVLEILDFANDDLENASANNPPQAGDIRNSTNADIERHLNRYRGSVAELTNRMEELGNTPLELRDEDHQRLGLLQVDWNLRYRELTPEEVLRMENNILDERAPEIQERIEDGLRSLFDTTYAARGNFGTTQPLRFANQLIDANT